MADTRFVILPKLLACRWRGVFHFEAYIENMNDFCQIDTVILTDDQKQKNQKTRVWVQFATQWLKMFPKFNRRHFANIVADDKTWVHYFELVSKFRNKIWLTTYMFVNTDCSCQMNHNSKKDHYCIFFSNDGICTCIAVQIPMSIGKRFTGWYNRVAVLKKLNKYYHKRLRKFLCQDLRIGMSFYFIIMLHHIHLSL